MPRTETVTRELYTYDELSECAKERARDWYREHDTEFSWAAEYRESLEAGLKLLGARARDWSVDCGGGYVSIAEYPADPAEESRWFRGGKLEPMEGARLAKWLQRHYSHELAGCCELTGFCGDDDFLRPLRTFVARPRKGTTLRDLVRECCDSWVAACAADIRFQSSDEYVSEHIIANGYEFLKNGEPA